MKFKTIVAVFIITLGVMVVIWQSIAWTTREKAVELGPVEIAAAPKYSAPLWSVLGGMALGIGAFMLISNRRRSL